MLPISHSVTPCFPVESEYGLSESHHTNLLSEKERTIIKNRFHIFCNHYITQTNANLSLWRKEALIEQFYAIIRNWKNLPYVTLRLPIFVSIYDLVCKLPISAEKRTEIEKGFYPFYWAYFKESNIFNMCAQEMILYLKHNKTCDDLYLKNYRNLRRSFRESCAKLANSFKQSLLNLEITPLQKKKVEKIEKNIALLNLFCGEKICIYKKPNECNEILYKGSNFFVEEFIENIKDPSLPDHQDMVEKTSKISDFFSSFMKSYQSFKTNFLFLSYNSFSINFCQQMTHKYFKEKRISKLKEFLCALHLVDITNNPFEKPSYAIDLSKWKKDIKNSHSGNFYARNISEHNYLLEDLLENMYATSGYKIQLNSEILPRYIKHLERRMKSHKPQNVSLKGINILKKKIKNFRSKCKKLYSLTDEWITFFGKTSKDKNLLSHIELVRFCLSQRNEYKKFWYQTIKEILSKYSQYFLTLTTNLEKLIKEDLEKFELEEKFNKRKNELRRYLLQKLEYEISTALFLYNLMKFFYLPDNQKNNFYKSLIGFKKFLYIIDQVIPNTPFHPPKITSETAKIEAIDEKKKVPVNRPSTIYQPIIFEQKSAEQKRLEKEEKIKIKFERLKEKKNPDPLKIKKFFINDLHFQHLRTRGSHCTLSNQNERVTIPIHKREGLSKGAYHNILKVMSDWVYK